jgi:hypothetical protein
LKKSSEVIFQGKKKSEIFQNIYLRAKKKNWRVYKKYGVGREIFHSRDNVLVLRRLLGLNGSSHIH